MGSSWKLVAVFAVLFLTGTVCGWLIHSSMEAKGSRLGPTRNSKTWTDDLSERVKRNGNLTAEQEAKARLRIEAAVRQMQALRLQSMIQMSQVFDTAIVEIGKDLPPPQEKLLEHFREKRHRWMQKQIERRGELDNP